MMKILITGIAGLIGSRLADYILETKSGVEVIGIDDLSGGYIDNVDDRVTFYNADCANTQAISDIFEKHAPDIVYHFAAYAAEGLSPFIRCFNYRNNLISTASIINNCIKHNTKRLVFTSSMAVYGDGKAPFSEEDVPNPIDPYGVAKYACELDIKIAGNQHNLDWCIIRPHNVYGDKQNIWDKYRNVLGIWMYQHINGQPMTIFGDGEQTRAFSFIDDSLEPFWNAAVSTAASKQIINLGGIKEYTINEACHTLQKVMGGGEIAYKQQRHEVKAAYVTHEKSQQILCFKHKTNLEEGLLKMWNWARQQPNRKQFIWDQYELDKGIYSFWQIPK